MSIRLDLQPMPDGYGFIYGQLHDVGVAGELTFLGTVNILPPNAQWNGQFTLDGYEPHDTDWIIYLDGEEFARARSRQHVEDAILQRLLPKAS
ncbi:MAG: hypothetical protein GC150_17685 [Rhizobiales bacterium]|nr:hypothetical protein [Hyphomicrobiales bacterium]